MEIFKPGIRVDFLKLSRPLLMLSATLVLGSWVSVATLGLNFGIDFAFFLQFNKSLKTMTPESFLDNILAQLRLKCRKDRWRGLNQCSRYIGLLALIVGVANCSNNRAKRS